ncbi:MAG: M20/M25/M40 family metallo-hydrolase [Armatimonadota bacterium]|nr:M20/M25/M40 family metallo-hydrolase [Armatimonadota bacterium]
MDLARTLEELCAVCAPSGHEDPMIARMRAGFAQAGLATRVDPLGNVIAPVRDAQPGYPQVAIFAHMDEVGFVVRKIEPQGFVRVQRMGGIPEKSMAGQRIVFLGETGPVDGVIATKAHHVTQEPEKARVVPVGEVFVDIGASGRADVDAAGIRVGTPATWRPAFTRRGDLVSTKAADDRVGCAALLALAEQGRALGGGAGLTLIAGVQEEFNIRGVTPAVRAVRPDILVCLDIVPANDTPDTEDLGEVRVGDGPTVGLYSFHGRGTLNGLIPNRKLVRVIETIAGHRGIPAQRHIFFGGLTDASYAQLEGPGIPGVDLGIPTRYTHSPIETCSLEDLRGAVALTAALIEDLPAGVDLSRG